MGRYQNQNKSAQTTLGWNLIMMRTNKMWVIIKLIKTIIINSENFAIQQQEQF